MEKISTREAKRLIGVSPRRIPALLADKKALRLKFQSGRGVRPGQPSAEDRAIEAIGSALAVVLAGKGWTPVAMPGTSPCMKRGEDAFEPFALVACLVNGWSPAETFVAAAERADISDTDLGDALMVGGPVAAD